MRALARLGVTLAITGTITGASVLDCGFAGATSNRTHLLNAWKALESDYNQIEAALSANNLTNAESGFIAFSRDCIPLATFETSFNTAIDADIFSIAQLGNAWAWIGYITVDSNSGVGPFKTETSKLTAAINKFNRDLSNNGLYEPAWVFRRLSRLGERMESWKRSELDTRGIPLS